ncbi:hypothetical protein A2U01_0059790, partial [Trifolium medium]|nr:hypothetical protein [Trifolium medium]
MRCRCWKTSPAIPEMEKKHIPSPRTKMKSRSLRSANREKPVDKAQPTAQPSDSDMA